VDHLVGVAAEGQPQGWLRVAGGVEDGAGQLGGVVGVDLGAS